MPRQAGDGAEEPASQGLLGPGLRKQEQAPGRQPRPKRASERQEDKEGYVSEDLRAEGFRISWVPSP